MVVSPKLCQYPRVRNSIYFLQLNLTWINHNWPSAPYPSPNIYKKCCCPAKDQIKTVLLWFHRTRHQNSCWRLSSRRHGKVVDLTWRVRGQKCMLVFNVKPDWRCIFSKWVVELALPFFTHHPTGGGQNQGEPEGHWWHSDWQLVHRWVLQSFLCVGWRNFILQQGQLIFELVGVWGNVLQPGASGLTSRGMDSESLSHEWWRVAYGSVSWSVLSDSAMFVCACEIDSYS